MSSPDTWTVLCSGAVGAVPSSWNVLYVDGVGPRGDKGLDGAGAGGTVSWNTDITDKPSTFPPAAHNQTASTITDFTEASRTQVEATLIAGTNVTITPAGTGATRTLTIATNSAATGPQGPIGPAGPAGADSTVPGPVGPQGIQGPIGPKGDTGNTGLQGIQGVKGDTGDTGPIGPQGPQGIQGLTGPAGAQGIQGVAGPAGADSTVPGPAGPTGATGPQGPQGPAGADSTVPGPQGIQGIQGPAGTTDYNLLTNKPTLGTAAATDSTAYAAASHAHVIADVTGLQTAIDLKADKTDWVDYSALSTINGIGTFSEKQIRYKIIDGYMFVDFSIFGTSNSTELTFTVPFPSAEGFTIYRTTGYLLNQGSVVNSFGRSSIANDSNVVILRRDAAGLNGWVTTSSKGTNGQISFKI